MALTDNIDITKIVSGGLDKASGTIYPIIWTLLGITAVILIIYFMTFRHKISIRSLAGNTGRPYTDRAREVKKDGVKMWQLMKRRDVIPIPPKEALIDITSGGKQKFFAEFVWSSEVGYVPLVFDVDAENFEEKVIVEQNGKFLKDAFQPFTPHQRSLLVSQYRKAEARRKKSLLDQISAIATPLVLAMIVVCGLLFWEDIAKPAKEMANINADMQAKQNEMVGSLAEISAQNARITTAITGETIPINQRIDGGGP